MEFFELVKERKTVRKYKPDMPKIEDIEKIIDAARLAPSGHNKQPWYFLVVANKELKDKMSEAVEAKYEDIKTYKEAQTYANGLEHSKKYSIFFNNAPVTIAVFMKMSMNNCEKIFRSRGVEGSQILRYRPAPDIQSIGAALQNLSLAACDLGYGTCWMTAPIVAYEELETLLEFDPEYNLAALVCLGIPDDETDKPIVKTKKSLNQIMKIID